MKKQLQGSRKPAQGTEGGIVAFGCDKSANLMPKNVEKVEIWPKRHLKCERTRVWKCQTAVYGIAPSVVDPQDTNCNFCSGLRQPGADTVRKTCDFWHFRAVFKWKNALDLINFPQNRTVSELGSGHRSLNPSQKVVVFS